MSANQSESRDSWWLSLSRPDFAREIAIRFAVNKADPMKRAYRKSAEKQAQARRGGVRKAQRYGVNIKAHTQSAA